MHYLYSILLLFSAQLIYAQCNLQASVNASPTNCYDASDGLASVVASGGTTPYNYEWSNGANNNINLNLSAGTYYVTVTDAASCVLIDSAIVIEPLPILVDVSIDSQVICGGTATGSATATVNGGLSPLSYNWESNDNGASATMLAAGIQVLTVIDNNGCVGRDTFTLTEPALIMANEVITNEIMNGACDGEISINPSGGSGPLQFFWYNGDSSNTTVDSLCSGSYTVVIIDSIGCSEVFDFAVDFDSNIAIQNMAFPQLEYYPNPIQGDLLYIKGLPSNTSYQVFNHFGQLIQSEQKLDQQFEINTQTWLKGLYYITFESQEGETESIKVVK